MGGSAALRNVGSTVPAGQPLLRLVRSSIAAPLCFPLQTLGPAGPFQLSGLLSPNTGFRGGYSLSNFYSCILCNKHTHTRYGDLLLQRFQNVGEI